MKRLFLAVALLSAFSVNAAEIGVTRLFTNSTIYGAEKLRVTQVDDLKLEIQQCDSSGNVSQCGKPMLYQRGKKSDQIYQAISPGINDHKENFIEIFSDKHIAFSRVELNMFEMGKPEQNSNYMFIHYYYN